MVQELTGTRSSVPAKPAQRVTDRSDTAFHWSTRDVLLDAIFAVTAPQNRSVIGWKSPRQDWPQAQVGKQYSEKYRAGIDANLQHYILVRIMAFAFDRGRFRRKCRLVSALNQAHLPPTKESAW
jgi:hypothetical protein